MNTHLFFVIYQTITVTGTLCSNIYNIGSTNYLNNKLSIISASYTRICSCLWNKKTEQYFITIEYNFVFYNYYSTNIFTLHSLWWVSIKFNTNIIVFASIDFRSNTINLIRINKIYIYVLIMSRCIRYCMAP